MYEDCTIQHLCHHKTIVLICLKTNPGLVGQCCPRCALTEL